MPFLTPQAAGPRDGQVPSTSTPPVRCAMSFYRIGVDVGGTNTDAAILDVRAAHEPSRGVLASHKAATTPDITSGIEAAIIAVLHASKVDHGRILSVAIGTTHFINALIEADARRLDRVAVVRLCGPFTKQMPPFTGFPAKIHGVLDGGAYYLDGGLEMDGRLIAPLDEAQVRRTARAIVASGVRVVALVGVFSPLDHDNTHEERCRAILRDEAPELAVVCSKHIGPTGLLERENATILNAAILRTGHSVKDGFQRAMERLRLTCPLYLCQNDGTLIDAATAADFPIKTFASGPSNSMSGAAFLAGLDRKKQPVPMVPGELPALGRGAGSVNKAVHREFDRTSPDVPSPAEDDDQDGDDEGEEEPVEPQVLVVDIGGTTTDVSVGHELLAQSCVFGGPTLTATDIVVAEGSVQLGDASLVGDVSAQTRQAARKEMNKLLETVIDQMKVSTAPVHVLLVGGGSILAAGDIRGVDRCIKPPHQGAANAVGAAIGKICGEIDTVKILRGRDEKAVIAAACKRAVEQAIAKGAEPDDVQIVEVNKMPLQYMSQVTIRIQIRAVGRPAIPVEYSPLLSEEAAASPTSTSSELSPSSPSSSLSPLTPSSPLSLSPPSSPLSRHSQIRGANDTKLDEQGAGYKSGYKSSISDASPPTTKPSLGVDIASYRPEVRDGVWYPSDVDLEFISTGCAVLGTGGGGPTYYEYLKSLKALQSYGGGRMRIISPTSLKDNAIVCLGSWYGSPSVINERLAAGHEIIDAINAVNRLKNINRFDGVLASEM
ncbi:hypothetical protein E4U53_003934 [Claviceps sorghi]|nr:hypothetical protein E4U53_003934 [Claviceps sorghi]